MSDSYNNLAARLELMIYCDQIQVGRIENSNLHIVVNCYSGDADTKNYTVFVQPTGSDSNKRVNYTGFKNWEDVYKFIDIIGRNEVNGE